jgi:hypothetical protein
MGSKQKTATSTSTTDPWSPQQPYIKAGMQEAANQYNSNSPQYFPGSTVAGFSPTQTWGNNIVKDRVSKDDFTSDPYQGKVYQNMASSIVPTVNAQFSSAGRYGSDSHADTMTRALSESFAPYASQQYQSGLDRRDNYLGMLQGVGSQEQGLAQSELDDAKNRFDYYQDLPANKLGQYMGFIGGNYGGTTTSAQPYYTQGLGSQILGGGLGLLGLLG